MNPYVLFGIIAGAVTIGTGIVNMLTPKVNVTIVDRTGKVDNADNADNADKSR